MTISVAIPNRIFFILLKIRETHQISFSLGLWIAELSIDCNLIPWSLYEAIARQAVQTKSE